MVLKEIWQAQHHAYRDAYSHRRAICNVRWLKDAQRWHRIAANIIVNLGTGLVSGLIAVMLADAVDYGEWRNGVRAEGIVTSFSSFSAKFGMGIGGAITGWILNWGGYVANHTQSASALNAISINYVWVPMVGFALSALALLFYKVDSFEGQMQADLRAKHARENQED